MASGQAPVELVQFEAERDRLSRLTRKGMGCCAVLPVGALLTRLIGGNLFAKSATLSPLSLLLAAVQFFY